VSDRSLTSVDSSGSARMVDVGAKPITTRRAHARGVAIEQVTLLEKTGGRNDWRLDEDG